MSSIHRVATANMYDNSIRNIGARQSTLVELNEKMTAGKRILRASDDPVAAAQAERAMTRIERIKTEQQALDVQRNAVAQAESAMGEAVGLVQNMRELLVNAGAGTHSPEDRRIIATQIQSLREELLNVSNRKDTNGLPLLGALGSALEPFLGISAPTGFAGLAGQGAGSSVSIPNMLDGDSAFMFQPKRDGVYNAGISNTAANPLNGRQFIATAVTVVDAAAVTTDAAGKGDVYKVVFKNVGAGASANTSTATYNIVNTSVVPNITSPDVVVPDFPNDKPKSIEITGVPGLKFTINATPTTGLDGTITRSPANGDTITLSPSTSIFNVIDQAITDIGGANNSNAAVQAVGQALANLDVGMERLQSVRSYAGELLNRADRITGNQDTREIQLEGDRSRAEDLDMVQGISDFQQTQVGYQAALQSYAMVQKLSMFNYIS
ncbi:MAG: flagellar hook-associated protein FlgL [Simplicispira sp.]|nr:flagellar hook-associated protein FlgL [Simplicispira sp.]